jgi:RNA polymerase sigma factor (sigma-70 family)
MEFQVFVEQHFDVLRRFSGGLTGDRFAAEDLLAEVLLRVWRRWRRISGMEYPVAYVRKMLVNGYLDAQRVSARRATSPLAESAKLDLPVAGGESVVDNRDEVDRLLALLTPHQRAAIALRYLADQSHAQIAEALG